jgi:hypothetical protein
MHGWRSVMEIHACSIFGLVECLYTHGVVLWRHMLVLSLEEFGESGFFVGWGCHQHRHFVLVANENLKKRKEEKPHGITSSSSLIIILNTTCKCKKPSSFVKIQRNKQNKNTWYHMYKND